MAAPGTWPSEPGIIDCVHPALFLDRDGIIIENRPRYVRSWTDVAFFPASLTALASIHPGPYKVVVVTNQSVVGRGIISLETADQINLLIRQKIEEAGGCVDAVFMCPHAPSDGCDCRKPQPGLLLRAASELSLDLSRSIMVGDALDDLSAGYAAGVAKLILLRSGRGAEQLKLPAASSLPFPFRVFDTLSDAIHSLPELSASNRA